MDIEDAEENDEDEDEENRPITHSEMTMKLQEIARSNEVSFRDS